MREVKPSLYGRPSELERLDRSWVDEQLRAAGTYWVCAASVQPHPRPVWGVWLDDALHLSIGSPVLAGQLTRDPRLTAHLDSGTDVVIVEGRAAAGASTDDAALAAYHTKYESDYDVAEFGNLTRIVPVKIIAWRAAGWAGRDGFRSAGKWLT